MPEQKSRTDWSRVKGAAAEPIPYEPEDGPYDPNNDASDQYFRNATVRRRGPQKTATKELISIRLSRDVLDYYRSTGEGWQKRIDEALKGTVGRMK
jgi:uncharacterized protein (DUF4415 family)